MNRQVLEAQPLEKPKERNGPAELPAPMTPDRRPHRGGWILAIVLVLAVLGAGYWYFEIHRKAAAQANTGGKLDPSLGRPAPVVASPAVSGDMPIYIESTANVLPLNTETVRTQVDGTLLKYDFVEGQTVTANQVIAEIDPAPFQAVLDQANGKLAMDQASLENAKVDLKRYTDAGSAYTDQQRATQKALVDQDTGQVESDAAAVKSAQVNLDYCTIRAPITGHIGLKQVDAGNVVHTSDVNGLVVITQLQPISVVFPVRQDDLGQIINKRDLPVQALDKDVEQRKILATGKLFAIDSQVDPTNDSVKVKAIFDNDKLELFPGQFVNVKLLADTLRNAVLVPAAAHQIGANNVDFIYVVGADSKVSVVNVKIGPGDGTRLAILSGIKVGDMVVTDGVDKLQPNSKVEVHSPPGAATQPSGATTRPGGHRRGANPSQAAPGGGM